MFWDIIRDSTKLGLKAGTVLGGLYFPVIWVGFPLLTWIQTGQPAGAPGGEVFTGIKIVLLSSLIGSLFGTLLGALNGLILAALTAFQPQNYLSQHWRPLAATCATLNLCGLTGLLSLMLSTRFFTDFDFSDTNRVRTNWVVDFYSDWPTMFMVIGAPALLAAGAAVWAMARMAKWYREAAPPDTDGPTLADDL